MKTYYIYLLCCQDGTLYCGMTRDLDKRVKEHNNSARGAKYTRGRRPVKLVYFEEYKIQRKALQRESEIKKLNKNQKLQLIQNTLE